MPGSGNRYCRAQYRPVNDRNPRQRAARSAKVRQFGIGKDDVGRFAARFELNTLKISGRGLHDPAIDYRMLRAYMAADDSGSPDEVQKRMISGREEATREVIENIRAKPDGEFKVGVFRLLIA